MKHRLTGIAIAAFFASTSFTSVTFAAAPADEPQQTLTAPQKDPNFIDVELSDINGRKVNARLSKDDLKKLKLQPGAALTLITLPSDQ